MSALRSKDGAADSRKLLVCVDIFLPQAGCELLRALWWTRMACGLAQGPTFAAVYHIYGSTIPSEQRARAVAAAAAGAPLGTAMFYIVGPLIEVQLGWRGALRAAGLCSLPWLMLWLRMDVDPPVIEVVGPGMLGVSQQARSSGTKSCFGLNAKVANSTDVHTPASWRELLSSPAVLSICLCHSTYAGGSYVLLAWMPSTSTKL